MTGKLFNMDSSSDKTSKEYTSNSNNNNNNNLNIRAVVLILLCLQNSGHALLTRYSRVRY